MTDPMGAGPRADWACLSRKCATEDGATVYELPVSATRCPVCGSKRLTRLWSGKAPGVLASGYRSMERVIDHAGSVAVDQQNAGKAALRRSEKETRELAAMGIGLPGGVRMAPIQQGAAMLGQGISGVPAKPAAMQHSVIRPTLGRRPRANVIGSDGQR